MKYKLEKIKAEKGKFFQDIEAGACFLRGDKLHQKLVEKMVLCNGRTVNAVDDEGYLVIIMLETTVLPVQGVVAYYED